jgi:hypothetical protein
MRAQFTKTSDLIVRPVLWLMENWSLVLRMLIIIAQWQPSLKPQHYSGFASA